MSSSLNSTQQTISWSYCDVQRKVDFTQPVTIRSVAATRSSSKALPKAKLAPKKGHRHWWSAARLIHYSFLNPGEIITSEKHAQQIKEMHRKLQHLRPVLVNVMGPDLRDNAWPQASQPVLPKFNELGYKVLPHPPYSPDLSPTIYHFKHLENFLQRKCLHNQEAENAFQELSPEAWIFTLQK